MKCYEHNIFPEIKIIENFATSDIRGDFVKTFHSGFFYECGLDFNIMEMYYSVSRKNTIRGMHFQVPPMEHDKLIHVVRGSVEDVIVDIRRCSVNFKKAISIRLSDAKPMSVFIPKGFAHGFKCLENDTIMLYGCSSVYDSDCDYGIRYDSIDYDWNVDNPIVSERDLSFLTLDEFSVPFQ